MSENRIVSPSGNSSEPKSESLICLRLQTYHSPLGIFLRKVHLSYRVLNFPQSLIIREDVLAWCAGDPEIPAGASAGSSNLLKKEKDSRIPDSETETQSSGEGGLAPGFSAKKGKRNIIANSKSSFFWRSDRFGSPVPRLLLCRSDRNGRSAGNAVDGSSRVSLRVNDIRKRHSKSVCRYQSACKRGDYSLALSSLEKFYSYRFPPNDK
jgi:hypothetical protein